MAENILNVRLQSAVEHTINGTQVPSNNSVPKNGEIVFNSDRTNFKVGDGSTQYSNLNNIIPSVSSGYNVDYYNTSNSSANLYWHIVTAIQDKYGSTATSIPANHELVLFLHNIQENLTTGGWKIYKLETLNTDTIIDLLSNNSKLTIHLGFNSSDNREFALGKVSGNLSIEAYGQISSDNITGLDTYHLIGMYDGTTIGTYNQRQLNISITKIMNGSNTTLYLTKV